MSGQTIFILKWSPTRQGYELFRPKSSEPLTLLMERLDEFNWLEEIGSFAFVGQTNSFTARKEIRPRGEGYWYAYRKQAGKLAKKYLGRASELTLSHMEEISKSLGLESTGPTLTSPQLPENQAPSASPLAPSSPLKTPEPPVVTPRLPLPGDPLLATKLHRPRPRPYLVHRISLTERLSYAPSGTLTLVSAPAGFGKTTLVADWLNSSTIPTAWVSLDAGDNEPARFFTYFINALQTIFPAVGKSALTILQVSQPVQLQTALTLLENDLAAGSATDFVLVLDDYHFINSGAIHEAMGSLLEHLPVQMHLIIVTRADPPLPLARLRARGQLTEIRVADLRFASTEAATFFHNIMNVELSSEEVEILQNRTEGWIAGLQFAALSLRGRHNIGDFLQSFSGSHRFVLDYLSEEVFSRQPPAVQNFLLYTSILERLNGSLCNALTGQEHGQATLESLERANMFVNPLDDERQWYRFHHLFADMLQSRLKQSQPSFIPQLHRRASIWYEANGLIIEAVRHAFAIPDFERVAWLIEQAEKNLTLLTQSQLLLKWFGMLPEELIRSRPLLSVIHARWLQMNIASPKEIEARLRDAELALENHPEDRAIVLSRVTFYRATLALYVGDLSRCITLAHQLLERWPEEGKILYVHTTILTLRGFLLSGDVTFGIEQPLREMLRIVQPTNPYTKSIAVYVWTRFLCMQGRLHETVTAYQSLEQDLGRLEVKAIVGGSAFFFGLGNIFREWNELDTAEQLLIEGLDIVRNSWAMSADVLTFGYIALVELYRARKNYQQAYALLEEYLQRAPLYEFVPVLVAWGKAAQVRLELSQRHLTSAVKWAENNDLALTSEPDYLREQEHLILARVWIAQGRENPLGLFLDKALALLDRLRQDAEAKARRRSLLEILILQSLALDAQQAEPAALSTLEQAVKLAEPEGYIRLFIDEGRPLLRLLARLQARQTQPQAYLARLIEVGRQEEPESHSVPQATNSHNYKLLPDQLSDRELEILKLIAGGTSNADIAARLVIEVSTVKRHVSNILAKLDASNRTQAVAQARALGLL